MNDEPRLAALADAAGLARDYSTIGGDACVVPVESLRAILETLGYATGNPGETLASLEAARAAELAPPVAASFEPEPPRVALNAAALGAAALEWTLAGEGQIHRGRCAADELERRGDKAWLVLPVLAPGYHRLRIAAGGREAATLLVRAPERAWAPETPERGYGLAIQLYEQIGPESIGIGDFSDLAGLGEAAGRLGAATLGLNPLHAPFLAAPERASPYSPSSRLALNPLYLDIRRLPGLTGSLRARLASPAFAARVRTLNAQVLVDYPTMAGTKLGIARDAFGRFRAAGGDPAFTQFCRSASVGVRDWASFEAAAVVHGPDFRDWPARLRGHDASALAAFSAGQERDLDFHLWLQWQAEMQLGVAARRGHDAGLAIGLYHDLALGADPAGAEVWAGGKDYAAGLSVGAPPDPLNPRGQNWGFPPLHPRGLCERGLSPFIELIRANMRHAGALRIDHVLGFNRLFVIPAGGSAADGAYLRYPLDLLLAVTVLESHRARCLVVGEDLGTVPAGLRERLAERGILSLRLLYFERADDGGPRRPEDYPRDAMAAVGSHDLPPLAGWWREDDFDRNDRLGLWPSTARAGAARRRRPAERTALVEAFRRAGLPGAEAEPPTVAAYRWLARTPSRLVSIQPEDAFDIVEPVNVPGTTDEEPNWRRRRLPPWHEWIDDPRFRAVLRAVQEERMARAISQHPR